MNEITRRIWDRGINLKKWCDINGFNYRYVVIVMSGKRGAWNVGTAKKIREAMVNQGFATPEDFKEVQQ
jgi:hypothetical protein